MKGKKMVLGAFLSVFVLMSTPLLVNAVQIDIQSLSKDNIKGKPKELLFTLDVARDRDIGKFIGVHEIELNRIISYLECDCYTLSNLEFTNWNFPIICTILLPVGYFFLLMYGFTRQVIFLQIAIGIKNIAEGLGCWWTAPDFYAGKNLTSICLR